MSRRVLSVIALLCACGPADPEIGISVSMSPLIAAGAVRAIVVLFPAPIVDCEVLRLSEKNVQPNRFGTYRSNVMLDGSPPHATEFFELVPGDYQLAVFVYDEDDEVVGFGCEMTAVTIELGKRSDVGTIEVQPPPGR